MITIYEPQGKAREYSPLALNIYKGCDHECFYCYVPDMLLKYQNNYNHKIVNPRENILKELIKSAKRFSNTKKQVLLSFTSDPYCKENDKHKLTSEALKILLEYRIPTAILSKGGKRILQDLDLFKQFKEHIKIGMTLTFDNDIHSKQYEPGAAVTSERIEVLKILDENNINTWISVEPVLNHKQSIQCIEKTINYVNHYKVGKLNHYPEIENKIDWHNFLYDSITILKKYNKPFYIKEDLRKFKKNIDITKDESNMDFLNVKPFEIMETATLF